MITESAPMRTLLLPVAQVSARKRTRKKEEAIVEARLRCVSITLFYKMRPLNRTFRIDGEPQLQVLILLHMHLSRRVAILKISNDSSRSVPWA